MAKPRKAQAGTGIPQGYQTAERSKIEKWEEGMVIEGTFVSLDPSTTKGYSPIAKFKDKATGKVRKMGTPADLQYKLENVPEGSDVFIRCNGKNQDDEWAFDVGFVPI